MEVVPLHCHLDLTEPCIDLLNEEWPRSRYSRQLSLAKSCEDLPASLLLLRSVDDAVLGHSRLCAIPNSSKDCWLESVVVWKKLRGQGLGRRLMELTENFAKRRGVECIYLSTHDKQNFYSHCGYDYCEPVFNIGANAKLLEGEQFKRFREKLMEDSSSTARVIVVSESPTAPPAPPPPVAKTENSSVKVQFMRKYI